MDKKGILKLSVGSIIFLVGIILFTTFFVENSGAIIQKNSYILGEKVKINLNGIENYKLKIYTPSKSYIVNNGEKILLFEPEETGKYKLVLTYGNKTENYEFEVFLELPDDNQTTEDGENAESMGQDEELPDENAEDEEKEYIDESRIKKVPANVEIFNSHENPTLKIEYDYTKVIEQESEFGKIVSRVESVFTGDGTKISLYDFNEELIEADFYLEKTPEGFDIIIEKEREIRPGLYRLELKIIEDGKETIKERWFLWGVLVLNPSKSIYLPGEIASFAFGVLNEAGNVVCDANLFLEVISPNGKKEILSTENGKIIVTESCGFLGVTSEPDYFAFYSISQIGNYSLKLIAETENGEYFIEDFFEVRSYVPFDIERIGPTRIYPVVDQQMKFRIKANENYNGKIIEKVPKSFEVTLQPEMKIKKESNEKILTWDVDFVAGEWYEFTYEFDAPDKSPELYLLGPLEIGEFAEIREWQIANDAEITIDSSTMNAIEDQYTTGASVVFINDSNGYVFYFDSGPQLSYRKSTDGGATWNSPVALTSQTDAYTFAIWHDNWTMGDTGRLIHVVFGETGGDAYYYKYLNATGDTLSTEVDATGDIGRLRERAQNPSIVKSAIGNLFLSGRDDSSGNGDIWKSTDNGTTWAITGASVFNADFNDEFSLIPLPGGDIMAIHADDSASDLIARRYNETNDTWMTGVVINASFEVSTTENLEASWGATVDRNGNIFVAGNNNPGTAGGAVVSFFYNGTGWTKKTDINSTIGAGGRGGKVSLDLTTGTVYATYVRSPTGVLTSSNIYYKSSSDNMTTWGTETQLSETTDDLMHPMPDLMNSEMLYGVWSNTNLNDFLGTQIVDMGAKEIQDVSGETFSTSTVTSISLAPFDYNRFVLGWCDDTLDKIKVAVYYTNGTGIVRDVDTTAGACVQTSAGQSVSVAAFDNNQFVLAWYDSVDSDVTFKIYNTTLGNLTGDIDVDTDAGTSAAVSVSAFNSTSFAVGWYDQASSDSTFQVYSISGAIIYGPFDADTDTDVDANSVDISAMNSTALVFAWFDSVGNDVIFQTFTINGTPISSVTADAAAGTSRTVGVTAINSTTFVLAWYDQNANDATYRVYLINGTVVTVESDVDADVGTARGVSISATSQEDFVFAWYDATTDIGISSQTFLTNTTQISSENVIQSNSQNYLHVSSEETATYLQLCENAYVIALANTTSNNFWKLYYSNGTVWSGTCPTYVPAILGNNVTNITITTANVVWNTNVKANSTVNYGTTLSLGTLVGQNFPRLNHSLALSGLTGSTVYYYNLTSCIDGRCNTTGPYNFTTSDSDTSPPVIKLISPANNSNITTGFDFEFMFNVSDLSTVSNCTFYGDGVALQLDNSITKDSNQTFYEFLSNGTHLWSVACIDEFNNQNITENRTINVQVSPIDFQRRFYETFFSSFSANQTAIIRLNNSRDGTQNDVTFAILAQTKVNVFNATTQFIGANGALIPSGSVIDFSASFTATAAAVEATWKIYIVNRTGQILLCQNGDDGSGGTPISTGTITATNTTCISRDIRLQPYDRVMMLMNAFNTHASAVRTITHAWDASTASQVDINITTEGFLAVNLTYPTSDFSINVSQNLNVTCQVNCSIGFCRNTQVYLQRNSSTESWTNVNGSGNIILASGETNPHSAGNLTGFLNTNFTIQGSVSSSNNNLRCIAVSSYDSVNGSTTRKVTVGQSDVAPVIILTNPANGTWYSANNVSVFYNITDSNGNIANSTLILNGARNVTNQTSILLGQINNFSLTNLADGVYIWTVNATDLTNLEGTNTSIRTFYVDTLLPTITLNAPANGTSFQTSFVEFNYTAFDNLDNTMICNLTIDSIVRYSDISSPNGTLINRTVSSLSVGSHLWNVTCYDDASNLNTSQTREFTVQDLAPTVDLITANNSFTSNGNITLIYNVTDNNGFLETKLILNGVVNQTNQSAILNGRYNNFTLSDLSEGIYIWNVNATDTGGLNATNNTARTFTVDLQSPNVTLNAPANNTYTNSSSISFNFTVVDSVDTSLTCNITAGEKSDLNFAASNGSLTNRQLTGFIDGGKYWNVTCMDDAGNYNISQTRFINITEYPTITLNTANNSFFNTTSFNLSYTPIDNTNLSSCEFFLDGVFNQTNQTQVRNGLQNNFSIVNIGGGGHTWYVACNDTIQLRNQSITRTFTVDTNGLNVSLVYPPNGASLFVLTLNLSFNATDNLDTTLDCNITANSVVVNSSTVTSGAITNRTVTFGTGGTKTWNVTCVDDSGNQITSSTRNFSLESAPIVTLNSPANNTFTNGSNVLFQYDISDPNNNLANSTLILNAQRNQTNQSALVNDATNEFNITLPDGIYNWTVNVTDLTNLEGTGSPFRILTIDTRAPLITLNAPANNSILSTNNLTFNFSISDNIDLNISCDLNIDDTPTVTKNYTNGTTAIEYVIRGDGTYTWSVDCTDDSGNNNLSDTRTFIVEAPPNVSLQSPVNNFQSNSSNITFIYLPEDPIGLANCSIFIDNSMNASDTAIETNQNNSFSVNSMPQGRHNWTVQCFDAFPDFNNFTAPLRNFTVDISAPNVTLNAPANNTNVLRTAVFNISAYDNLDLDNILQCNLYIDNTLNQSSFNITNGSSVSFSVASLILGTHTWNASCIDDSSNRGWSLVYSFNVTLADLMVNASSLAFNASSPRENESLMINATIYNLINVTVTNITVAFYEGDPDSGGTQIGLNQTVDTLAPLASILINISWYAKLGTNYIFVVVDPPYSTNGSIREWNETNNKANKSTTTGAWHFVYGDINSESVSTLEDIENLSVVRWPATNFQSGNLYVIDSESVISWTTLQAIGKNNTDSNTSNDFADIDSLLNMTGFADSVSDLYTNSSGTILNQTNFIIFNRIIDEIPIANSTNNTNFVTGILWDTSDDSNGQYSQNDKEDLIFLTKVNQNSQGAYGVYDYEIRIPARLREYYDTESRRTVFFAELN